MSNTGSFQPNWASAPGDTITDILNEKQISLSVFAKKMNSTIDYVRNLLHGYVAITEEIASQLEAALGASAQFWINRELKYREAIERLRHVEEEKWLKELPTSEMIKRGWIDQSTNLVENCLNFFAVPDVWTWRRKYRDVTAVAAFRKSSAIQSTPGGLAVWIRQGEIMSSEINCSSWNKMKLKESLPEIRTLLRKKSPIQFLPELKRICADCGIALVVLQTTPGCSASGATKFVTNDKAMILLSFRHLAEDHFWFTFFHEVGHLLLHDNTLIFIEDDNVTVNKSLHETEANNFSSEVLIPKRFKKRLETMPLILEEFKTLSRDADITLGIIVGQLQHLGRVPYRNLNGYKRTYTWTDISKVC